MRFFDLFCQEKKEEDKYWIFEKSEHFRPKISKGDFYSLVGTDFLWHITEQLSNFTKDKNGELTKAKSFSYGQKALYYWWYLDGQVNNGGFIQFFFNGYYIYTPTIIKGLKHIGDTKAAGLVERAYEQYLIENKKFKSARSTNDLQDFSNLYKEVTDFEDLDSIYYSLEESTIEKFVDYIRQNPNEFCTDESGQDFDSKYTGEIITKFKNSKVKESYKLLKGVIDGDFISYYENGNIKEELNYNKGKQQKERLEYYENGNLKYSIAKSDTLNGFLHTHYFENGRIKSIETYISEYKREGKWNQYFSNGQLKSETEFINGEFFVQNCWKEDGTQIMKDGTGLYIHEYSPWEGLIQRSEEEYVNYKRHGKQYTYNNNKVSLYQEMKNGKEDGITKSYDDGNLRYEVIYENGKEIKRTNYK